MAARRLYILAIFISGIAIVSLTAFAQNMQIRQGADLVRIAGCADCHTAKADLPMAGGYRLKTEFGDFFTPNITPDLETGIGRWSEKQFHDAIRFGKAPSGRSYYPAFPYRSFSKITDLDIHKMYLYLHTLPPIRNKNRPHELKSPYNERWLMVFWKLLFFSGQKSDVEENIKDGVGPFTPDDEKSAIWNRGAYLTEALAHCAECHTPRNSLGQVEIGSWMAGTKDPVTGRVIPNITPDFETGLGKWSRNDWQMFLESGYTPELRTPGYEMAEVIQNTSALSERDRNALVEYLISLKPVSNDLN